MFKKSANPECILELMAHQPGLSQKTVEQVAAEANMPAAEVYGVGTFYSLLKDENPPTRVCLGLSCQINGAQQALADLKLSGEHCVGVPSCLGQCDRAPVAIDSALNLKLLSRNKGVITPSNSALPINLAGEEDLSYSALAIGRKLSAEEVLEKIYISGLQGRGGAGFPAHFKWKSVMQQPVGKRYVVCNADEGEPGTFKDREVMLRRPHLLIEGLAIAALTVGATDIYIYIRGEFKAELKSVQQAIAVSQCHTADFKFHIVKGHGAYICGEETALIESLEGKRGMPRLKPPYPTVSGFRGKPTLMHNVETLACIAAIVLKGGKAFAKLGKTEAGTKLYCISGHVQQPGVYELPLGITLDELVEAAGGYLGKPLAFSPGGASSGFLPMAERNTPLDYKSLTQVGSMLGSAGVVVLNDTVDMAQAACWQLGFFEAESCGQCAPCRIGSRLLHRQVKLFLETRDLDALKYIHDVAWEMKEGSICGLGMVAAEPLISALKYFPEYFKESQLASPVDRLS